MSLVHNIAVILHFIWWQCPESKPQKAQLRKCSICDDRWMSHFCKFCLQICVWSQRDTEAFSMGFCKAKHKSAITTWLAAHMPVEPPQSVSAGLLLLRWTTNLKSILPERQCLKNAFYVWKESKTNCGRLLQQPFSIIPHQQNKRMWL